MKNICIQFFLILLTIFTFSCNGEDGVDGVDGLDGLDGVNSSENGQAILVFSGDITNEDAATIVQENAGKNTHTLLIKGTTNLTTIDLSTLTNLAVLKIRGNEKLLNFTMSNLESIADSIQIVSNPMLESISFPNLTSTLGDFYVSKNEALRLVDLSNLSIIEDLSFSDHLSLESINLPLLETSFGEVSILNNSNLKALDLDALVTTNSIRIYRNSSLTATSFSNLKKSNRIIISQNEALLSFNFDGLEQLGFELTISSNIELTTLSFPLLNSIGNEENAVFSISNNQIVSDVSFPSLEVIGDNSSRRITIGSGGANLQTINFNRLATIYDFTIRSGTTLTNIDLSSLKEFNSLSFPRLSAGTIDSLTNHLIKITPALTGKLISFQGTVSAEALTIIETLRSNGNTIHIRN